MISGIVMANLLLCLWQLLVTVNRSATSRVEIYVFSIIFVMFYLSVLSVSNICYYFSFVKYLDKNFKITFIPLNRF